MEWQWFTKGFQFLFGSHNERKIKELAPRVAAINELAPAY